MKKSNSTAWAVYLLFVLALIAVAAMFLYKNTGGFETDFKTFYVNVNGKSVFESANGYGIKDDEELKVNVVYTFSKVDSAKKGYSVKVVPNVEQKNNFKFTVDGEEKYFDELSNFAKGFNINKRDDYFTISAKGDLNAILKAVCDGEEISDCVGYSFEDMFALEVYSYNGKNKVTLYFCVLTNTSGVRITPSRIEF